MLRRMTHFRGSGLIVPALVLAGLVATAALTAGCQVIPARQPGVAEEAFGPEPGWFRVGGGQAFRFTAPEPGRLHLMDEAGEQTLMTISVAADETVAFTQRELQSDIFGVRLSQPVRVQLYFEQLDW